MTTDTSNTIFQKAVLFVNQTNKHLFITGKAGTGKTTFLKYIRENTHKKIAITAPTGVAAINAGGMTIHSFFQLPLGIFLPVDGGMWSNSYSGEVNNRSTLLRSLKLRNDKKTVLRELDILVIDEISMVRADLLDAIDTVLRYVRKQPLMPFGGVQMVYIGDLFQLPPVARQQDWAILEGHYKSPFFFDAKALQYAPPLYVELKKIYRQKDDLFINILNNVRNNCCTNSDLEMLHHSYHPSFAPVKGENYVTLTSHNSKADAINQTELNMLPGKTYTYHAEVTGEFYERSYPADKDLKLKVGAQIMFIKNDKGEARRYYNGKIGTVKYLDNEKITVVFPNENDELEIETEKWENIRYTYDNTNDSLNQEPLGTFIQYPLRLAWAITIHKSQGLTFEKAIVDAGASFAAGQVYVSLSRLTSLQGLVLHSRILPGCISTDPRVVEYVEAELNEDELQNVLETEQRVYVRQSLLQSFEWQKLCDVTATHLQEYEHRQIPDKEKSIGWAKELNNTNTQMQEVAEKFKLQLEKLFTDCEQDQYKTLHQRMEAACSYFIKELDENLITHTQKHIDEIKVKLKIKRYVKDLQEMQLKLVQKKQQLHQALQLSMALQKSSAIEDLLKMVEHNKTTHLQVPQYTEAGKNGGKEKGESRRISLQLFKQGKAIADIAAERGMAANTIEAHLAGFICTGEVDILDLLDNATLTTIIEIIENEPHLSHGQIRLKAGNNVNYSMIKAVLGYRELMKEKINSNPV